MENIGRIIDKELLENNVLEIKRVINNRKICAMVKADAYGHGLKNIICLDNLVDYFGVATLDEGIKLKKFGVNAKILIVGKTEINEKIIAIQNNISFSIFTYEDIEQLHNANFVGIANIHIKINSGMNRLGISKIEEYKRVQDIVLLDKRINFEGVFTHFCSCGIDEKYFNRQNKVFEKFLKTTYKNFKPLVHVGGSSVINKSIKADMFRVGLSLYGYQSSYSDLNLKPIMRVVSKVLQVISISKNQIVGYAPFVKDKKIKKVATIFYGYADGVNKSLTNKHYDIINGQKCKVIAVCMDMHICDVSNFDVKVGDEVVIMNNASIMAKESNEIVYEVLTGFKNLR